ncbi:MAG: Gfo/Idh/MocA family oxidoreductase [Acidobacteria bacterium]|nr:Gfo/Idh/MocA family oxidoreductase [Acidobacteriota bacterium]
MNRRTFITVTTGTVLGGRRQADAEVHSGSQLTEPRIKIGFLGSAYSHAAPKLKLLRNHPDFELVGAWDDAPAVRAAAEKQGVRILSPEEVLAQCQVAAVESVVRDHARYARMALAAGKHVHLEKPPSMHLADFREIVAMARDKRLLLQVGYQYRYSPPFNAVVEATRNGWLGDVYMVRATMNNLLAVERRAEWGEFRGGVMFELGSHMIEAIVRLLGKPRKVTPFLFTHGRFDDRFIDNTAAVLEYPRTIASVFAATFQPNSGAYRALEVLGTNGTATIRPIEPPTLEMDLAKEAGPYKAGVSKLDWPKWERFSGDFAELARAVRGKGRLCATLDDELAVQETLLLASGME